jgi:hypothetical protein
MHVAQKWKPVLGHDMNQTKRVDAVAGPVKRVPNERI